MISPETSHLAWAITQIKPGAKSISYVKVQQQLRGYNGCGPLSLSYFWSLARKIYPHSFEYQHEQMLRTTVRRIVETGTLENLIPRMTEKSIRIPKSIIRTYKRASGFDSTNFYLQQKLQRYNIQSSQTSIMYSVVMQLNVSVLLSVKYVLSVYCDSDPM